MVVHLGSGMGGSPSFRTLLRLAKRIDVPLLSKPFSTTHLLEAVERALGGSIKPTGSNFHEKHDPGPSRCKQV